MVSKKKEVLQEVRSFSNVKNYNDPKPVKVLDKKDLNKMALRSLFLQASFNFERMQAGGWVYGINPGLKKIHTNDRDLSMAMQEHMEFFNTHPFLVTFIQGIILSMEENKANRDTIRAVKVAMMGPLGGIGDALFWLTLLPIAASIGAAMAMDGNILGPIVFLIIFNAVHLGLRFGLIHYAYKQGTKAVASLKDITQKISRAGGIVGMIVVGGLIPQFVRINFDRQFFQYYDETLGKYVGGQDLQGIFDSVMPAMLPLGFTFFCYWQLKKGRSPLVLIFITMVVGILGYLMGIF